SMQQLDAWFDRLPQLNRAHALKEGFLSIWDARSRASVDASRGAGLQLRSSAGADALRRAGAPGDTADPRNRGAARGRCGRGPLHTEHPTNAGC
ncbi:hypothetical protein B2A_15818, partial [mine drainage metagenome]